MQPSDIDRALGAIRDEERRRMYGAIYRSRRDPEFLTSAQLDRLWLSDREKLELLVEIQNGKVR
jgi:hypothetical protein